MVEPPSSEAELLARVRSLAARTVGEVARDLGIYAGFESKHAKGFAGMLAERALGADAGSLDEPDFTRIGIELKTLPMAKGSPKESTYVCIANLEDLENTDFERSTVFRKLSRVLWLPIDAAPIPLHERRFGSAFCWSPSDTDLEQLRTDYEELASRVARGDADDITAHVGAILQLRPKGANGRQRVRYSRDDGSWGWTGPRGFYLRPAFTKAIVDRYFGT